MSKLPSHIQTCRKVLHLEVDKKEVEMITHLVQYAKKKGIYKKWWGPHAHPTEGVDWNSPPGDLKRAAKFAVKSTNYNASMTSAEVYGFLDINDVIHARKPDGSIIRSFTGRECLTTFFKFQDSSSLIAEAHQQEPMGPVSLVYPNTPEGEKLITGLAKQIAAFVDGHFSDQNISQDFTRDFTLTYIDPQIVHEAAECEWDSDTQTLLTPMELAEDFNSTELEAQGWWKDVVEQYEQKQAQGKRPYASRQALFDLDGSQSVKTMHEANDSQSMDNSQESVTKKVKISQGPKEPKHSAASHSGSAQQEDRGSRRSGHTPTSVGVRGGVERDMEEDSEEGSFSSAQDASSTASVAVLDSHQPGKAG